MIHAQKQAHKHVFHVLERNCKYMYKYVQNPPLDFTESIFSKYNHVTCLLLYANSVSFSIISKRTYKYYNGYVRPKKKKGGGGEENKQAGHLLIKGKIKIKIGSLNISYIHVIKGV